MTEVERIEKLRDYASLSWRALSMKIGWPNQQKFYDIRRGRYHLSYDAVNDIVATFPEIRREWLMTGEGPMLKKNSPSSVVLYPTPSSVCATPEDSSEFQTIDVGSCFPGASIALRNSSTAMSEYPVGCILILKEVADPARLAPGANYLVITPDLVAVRRAQKGRDAAHVSLYSTNCETFPDGRLVYEPIEVATDSVSCAYLVQGYIYLQAQDINNV